MLRDARGVDSAISSRLFLGTLAGLRRLEVDVVPVLARLGVRVEDLGAVPQWLPPSTMLELWRALVEVTGRGGYGLRLARQLRAEHFPVLGDVIASSATLGDALGRGVRLLNLFKGSARYSVQFDADRASLVVDVAHRELLHPEAAEFLVAAPVVLSRELTGVTTAGAREVRFVHDAPRHANDLRELFGCPVRFSASEDSITFETAVLSTPVLGHDPSRLAARQKEAEALLAELSAPGDFRRDVIERISRELGEGDASIERVAGRLGLHPRTLSRRLRAEDTSYRELLDEVRFRLARSWLDQPGVSVAEIAFRLAYSEKSAFIRAFRRWAGMPPDAYRKRAAR